MENGAFAPMEQMHDFPSYFQIHDISNASKGAFMELRVKKESQQTTKMKSISSMQAVWAQIRSCSRSNPFDTLIAFLKNFQESQF